MARLDRWRLFRTGALSGLLLVLGAPGGCPAVSVPGSLEVVGDVDFAHLAWLNTCVLDVHDVGAGVVTKRDLFQRYAAEGAIVYREFPALDFGYMVLTDAAAQTQYVFLPGSHSLGNLGIGANTLLEADGVLGVCLHRGYRGMAQAVRSDLAGILREGYELTLAGYSLGGATAVILGQYLLNEGWDVQEVVTFGQPAVTDAGGASTFSDLPLLRVISGDDVIPRARTGGYVQFGPSLVVLDGPYVLRLSADECDISPELELVLQLADVRLDDHVAYGSRMRTKLGGTIYDLRPVAEALSGRAAPVGE
jgi:hypothetical protein